MIFNEIAESHYDWVESLGWHNKTILEGLALIASELGEVSFEILTAHLNDESHLAEELADVCLRVVDVLYDHGIDIDAKMKEVRSGVQWNSVSLEGDILEIMADFGKVVNSARYAGFDAHGDFSKYLATILCRVCDIAERNLLNLNKAIRDKMTKNLERGNRGRVI